MRITVLLLLGTALAAQSDEPKFDAHAAIERYLDDRDEPSPRKVGKATADLAEKLEKAGLDAAAVEKILRNASFFANGQRRLEAAKLPPPGPVFLEERSNRLFPLFRGMEDVDLQRRAECFCQLHELVRNQRRDVAVDGDHGVLRMH